MLTVVRTLKRLSGMAVGVTMLAACTWLGGCGSHRHEARRSKMAADHGSVAAVTRRVLTESEVAQLPPITVATEAWYRAGGDGAEQSFEAGDTLHTGDRVGWQVTVDQPAYVYLVQFYQNGIGEVLYPRDGHERLCPFVPRPIPASSETRLVLGESSGVENVYVVASTFPLDDPAGAVRRRVATVHATVGEADPGLVSTRRSRSGAHDDIVRDNRFMNACYDLLPDRDVTSAEPVFPDSRYLPDHGMGIVHFQFRHAAPPSRPVVGDEQ